MHSGRLFLDFFPLSSYYYVYTDVPHSLVYHLGDEQWSVSDYRFAEMPHRNNEVLDYKILYGYVFEKIIL